MGFLEDILGETLAKSVTTPEFLGSLLTTGGDILTKTLAVNAAQSGFEKAAGISSAELNNIIQVLNAQRDEARENRDFLREQLATERLERAVQLRFLFDFAEEQIAREEPFRQAGLEGLESLIGAVKDPTTTEAFKIASQEGVDLLRRNFARTGSPSSGPAQIASGKFLANLTAAENAARTGNLFRLAGFGTGPSQGAQLGVGAFQPLPSGVVTGDLPSAVPGFSQLPSLAVQSGATQAGLFSSIGKNLAQLPLQISLSKFLNT